MTPEEQARLRNLARIYNIAPQYYSEHPEVALEALMALYAVPLIDNRHQQGEFVDAFLLKASYHFDKHGIFIGRLRAEANLMLTLPAYRVSRTKSTNSLVEEYLSIEQTVWWLAAFGFGAGVSAGAAGYSEYLKKDSLSAGAKKTAGRLLGRGAIAEAMQQRFGPRTGRAGGIAGVLAIAAGTTAYHSGIQRMEKIRDILFYRYQNGADNAVDQVTDEQFNAVFGTARIQANQVKKYWE